MKETSHRICYNSTCGLFNVAQSNHCNQYGEAANCAKYYPQPHPTEVNSRSIFDTIAAEIGELVTEKNRCYGNSFAKCGDFLRLLYPSGITPESYDDALAMVRIFDKQMRIATQKDTLGESPYRDIAGYGILGAAKDQGEGE